MKLVLFYLGLAVINVPFLPHVGNALAIGFCCGVAYYQFLAVVVFD